MARRGENIYKRKDGRYEGRYIKGYNANGKAIYGYIYSKSYSDVKEKTTMLKSTKKYIGVGSSMKLSEWFDIWLDSETDIKKTTKSVYEGHIRNHILPELGNKQLKKITTEDLQKFVSGLDLSPSTVKLVFSILKSALKSAEEKGYVSDTWSNVKLPKKKKSEIAILTISEQKKLENVLSKNNDIGILICLYTGLRIGEICALKWEDINLEKSLIHVRTTQARINGKIEFISPKSKSSERTVPIPDFLRNELSDKAKNSEFLISKHGSYVDVRTYRRRFKKLLKKAGLSDIKFHALRHTFATRALEVGMEYKTLSEILGHSSVAFTMDVYVHSLEEHKKSQMNKLEKIFDLQS